MTDHLLRRVLPNPMIRIQYRRRASHGGSRDKNEVAVRDSVLRRPGGPDLGQRRVFDVDGEPTGRGVPGHGGVCRGAVDGRRSGTVRGTMRSVVFRDR